MTRAEAIEVLQQAGKPSELVDRYVRGAETEMGPEYWQTLDASELLHDFELFEEAQNAST